MRSEFALDEFGREKEEFLMVKTTFFLLVNLFTKAMN